jgi:tRNA splicing ligase
MSTSGREDEEVVRRYMGRYGELDIVKRFLILSKINI